MATKISLFFFFSFLFLSVCWAQEKKEAGSKNKVPFHRVSVVQVGTIHGEQGMEMQLQLINGISYRSWQLGLGGGLDYYYVRSVPVFLDVRKLIKDDDGNLIFIYGQGGFNYPWVKKVASLQPQDHFEKGLFYDAGIGYQFRAKKRSGFLLSAGYSQKWLTASNTVVNPCLIGPCPLFKNEYDYTLKRWSFKAGYRF